MSSASVPRGQLHVCQGLPAQERYSLVRQRYLPVDHLLHLLQQLPRQPFELLLHFQHWQNSWVRARLRHLPVDQQLLHLHVLHYSWRQQRVSRLFHHPHNSMRERKTVPQDLLENSMQVRSDGERTTQRSHALIPASKMGCDRRMSLRRL